MLVHMEMDIEAPADLVWKWLGPEFVRIDLWSSFVKESKELAPREAPTN